MILIRELIKSRSKHWSIKKKIKETGFGLTRVETNSTSCTVVSPSHFLDALIQNLSLIQKHWHRCLNHLLCWGFRSTASKYSRMCFITQLTGSRVQRGGHKQWVLYVKKKPTYRRNLGHSRLPAWRSCCEATPDPFYWKGIGPHLYSPDLLKSVSVSRLLWVLAADHSKAKAIVTWAQCSAESILPKWFIFLSNLVQWSTLWPCSTKVPGPNPPAARWCPACHVWMDGFIFPEIYWLFYLINTSSSASCTTAQTYNLF